MDDIDIKILDILQLDSDIPNNRLARLVNLSPSSVLGRVRRLKREGYIRKCVAILDEEKIGKSTTAYVFITLSPHKPAIARSFVKKIQGNPHVNECSHITGEADYLLRVVARDIPEYRDVLFGTLISMPEVETVRTWFVLKTEKRDTRFPIRSTGPGRKESRK
jgi:Lrp/AsnC family leucine-responsive transcriptional regulator